VPPVQCFSVWAPDASSVEVVLFHDDGTSPGTPVPLAPEPGGWWRVQIGGAGHGSDYGLRVDGGEPLPDPRSGWQPYGVNGPSRVFHADRHQWTDGSWRGLPAAGAVHYELNVATFTSEGTLDAAIARLPHLVDLGVEMVELMPVAAMPGRWGWGYDGAHPNAVHEPYGGPAALQRFVNAAHAAGLGVCLDVVYNHLGPSGNYLERFGPYFTQAHHTPWGATINLDGPGSPEVRRWICDNALRWFRDFHIDALRLDAVHALLDDSEHHVLAQLSEETAALSHFLRRPLSLVAESDLNDPVMITPTAAGGRGMTGQWSDDFHHAVHALLTGERQGYYVDFGPPEVVRTVWREAFWHAGRYSPFRGGDWGRPVDTATVGGHRFVVCSSNHDQVGNRAIGDRPAATLSGGLLALSAALVLTSPFTPMLFMGEEWGAGTPFQYFTDFDDPDLAAAVTAGRRREFAAHGWDADDVPDPQDPETRLRSVLDWAEREQPRHAALLDWYRTLLRLRRELPDLSADDLRAGDVTWSETGATGRPDWLVLRRGSVHVVGVLTEHPIEVTLPGPVEALAAFGPVENQGEHVRSAGHGVLVARRLPHAPA